MLATARTFTLDGISARPVRVEVDVHRGLPGFAIVGLPDAAVREARERVRAALVNCGFEFPLQRIVVNLAPASLRKAGPGMDLAIATALLSASGQLEWEALPRLAFTGELALDGSTRAVNGALAIAEAAREGGAEAIVVPAENGPEAALAAGIDVIALDSLGRLPELAAGEWKPVRPPALSLRTEAGEGAHDLADLRGQPHLRHALEVAAAGGHSLLMIGPPGAGKSLAASRLPSILPPLAPVEALEVARIASARGQLGDSLPGTRPFRAPHHTISPAGLIGGGTPPRPGEITLAHRGVLFLDELCEFRRDALEALRAPLESGEVSIARAGSRRSLPCRFTLIAAANPCPCGRGEADLDCNCAPVAVQRYQGRLSGALADRIDILAAVRQPGAAEIGGGPGEPSADVRERVMEARERQEWRLGPGRCNAEMSPGEARECALSAEAGALLAELYARQRLSGRAHDRALRLARTIADLAGAETIDADQMAQALQLRRRDRG
ncbi:MAG TPA: YifB family Mg chelatase-like AAA ATPase [Solirubrobacterales bacterium]|nr:YifB family Mg chelatase-like AAA ATPase [Solirubrobacterales bacterium]